MNLQRHFFNFACAPNGVVPIAYNGLVNSVTNERNEQRITRKADTLIDQTTAATQGGGEHCKRQQVYDRLGRPNQTVLYLEGADTASSASCWTMTGKANA